MGKVKSGRGSLVGNAGEHYVVAELLKRDIIADLTPRNTPGFDVFAMKDGRSIMIRVKTKSEQFDMWQWSAKQDGEIFLDMLPVGDFTILVNLAELRDNLAFFVIPTREINIWLTEGYKLYLETPGRGGRPHKDSTLRGIRYSQSSSLLEPYREAWKSLWE